MIRLTRPSIEEEDLQAVRDCLASGFLVQGARVAAFEQAVARHVGIKHAVAVSNCTCALHLALLSLGVHTGDICVVTAYSWVSTANVIELCGARPVFVDVDPRTYNIDLNYLENTLNQLMSTSATAHKVKAVIPVHTFGQMVNMQQLSAICGRWNIPVVEDAACALGATFEGKQAGSLGDIGCFSFHPRKAITTGEGGILTTNDDMHARRLRALRNHGVDPDAAGMDFIVPGHNYRLTEFQAALGVTQMSKLQRIIDARRSAAERYNELLGGTMLQKPYVTTGARHVYQSYVALLPAECAENRSDVIAQCRLLGVETQIGTVHIPLTTYYRSQYSYRSNSFPNTDAVAARAITLPLFETITHEQQQFVATSICNVLG